MYGNNTLKQALARNRATNIASAACHGRMEHQWLNITFKESNSYTDMIVINTVLSPGALWKKMDLRLQSSQPAYCLAGRRAYSPKQNLSLQRTT